ncbi:DUF4956 domain-containing protein [Nocardioides bruguierae]|uniref:DUF4956 domain-containing protein n=1 Tax=Nocardioides bruguierae TaxID=2945102 RepID=A0A9X2D7F0_9ACTN|nr:DUF4956 domain-containing protein [Nocardioides bruguierae]MCM0620643.1 DUF4956 domain-containing protein [Nocardioides bruguierae]
MTQLPMLAIDLVAVLALVGLFLLRHRRPELAGAYLAVNVGVLAVTAVLADSTVGAGLGLGLFGVLSIIRLRSTELAHHEIAYYFAALTLGLVAGVAGTPSVLVVGLMAAVLVALWVGDHPRLAPEARTQEMVLDRAWTDMAGLTAHLEGLLGAEVLDARVTSTNLVNDTTTVTVRHRPAGPRHTGGASAAPGLAQGAGLREVGR